MENCRKWTQIAGQSGNQPVDTAVDMGENSTGHRLRRASPQVQDTLPTPGLWITLPSAPSATVR